MVHRIAFFAGAIDIVLLIILFIVASDVLLIERTRCFARCFFTRLQRMRIYKGECDTNESSMT